MKCWTCATDMAPSRTKPRRFCSSRCRVANHRHPKPLPAFLLDRDAWAVARGKRPVQPDGSPASSTDRSTWSSWSEVADRPHGVMLGDGLGCLDLDHCLVDGVASPLVAVVLASVEPVWVERSMSGDGLHVFVELAPDAGRVLPGVEVYSRDRFIVVTGDAWPPVSP